MLTTAQFVALHRACYQYSVDMQIHSASSIVHFSVPWPEDTDGETELFSERFEKLAHKFTDGKTAEQIVVEMIDWTTDHYCERCEKVSEDDFVDVSDGELICFDCYENMIDAADYEQTLNSMRGRI